MQACPFQLRLIDGTDTAVLQIEVVATQIVAQMRHAIRGHPAVRHVTVVPAGWPPSIEGVAFVVGEEDDSWRTVVRIIDDVLAHVAHAGELFERVAPPAPAFVGGSPAMAASGQFTTLDRWPAS